MTSFKDLQLKRLGLLPCLGLLLLSCSTTSQHVSEVTSSDMPAGLSIASNPLPLDRGEKDGVAPAPDRAPASADDDGKDSTDKTVEVAAPENDSTNVAVAPNDKADLAAKYRRRSYLLQRRQLLTPAAIVKKGEKKNPALSFANPKRVRRTHAQIDHAKKLVLSSSGAGASVKRETRSNSYGGSRSEVFFESSPIYLDSYDYVNNMDKYMGRLTGPYDANNIQVSFSWMDTESTWDTVKIYDYYGLCATYSGYHTSFDSTLCRGNYVDVYFHSDSSTDGASYDGFLIDGFSYWIDVPNAPPDALGFADSYTRRVGESVNFDASLSFDPDGPTNQLSYYWDFGDGSSSTSRYPSHAYSSRGTYEVWLKVTDADGGYDWDNFNLTISPQPPVASFALKASTVQTGTAAVAFPNSNMDALRIRFDWGDGAVTNDNPFSNRASGYFHVYSSPGTYLLRMTAENESGSSLAAHDIVVTGSPVPPALEISNRSELDGLRGREYRIDVDLVATDDGLAKTGSIVWGGPDPTRDTSTFAFTPKGKLYYTATAAHAYMNASQKSWAGVYTLKAIASDDRDNQSAQIFYTFITQNLKPVINRTTAFHYRCAARACSFNVGVLSQPVGRYISDADGTVDRIVWTFKRSGQSKPLAQCPAVTNRSASCKFASKGTYNVTLSAVDNLGARSSMSRLITVR
ncbi:MAG: PKD domain-containing protein [Bdellovibrionota bacterium]